jgi:predicted amidohydrolase
MGNLDSNMNTQQLSLAIIQPTSTNNTAENVELLHQSISQIDSSISLISLPECANFIEKNPLRSKAQSRTEAEDLYLQACKEIAKTRQCWIHIGSLVIADKTSSKAANRAFILSPQGEITARYDKCHLFDVDLPDGTRYRESDNFIAGTSPTIAETPWGKLGLSICFDMRFPSLYQHYRRAGVNLIFIPAAFTVPTGKAHWESLLRARAIETQSYVIAAAQVGKHADGRETYGHSMVINPWGEIIAQLGEQPDLLICELDMQKVQDVRNAVPLRAFDD